jgi:hypothetical protein
VASALERTLTVPFPALEERRKRRVREDEYAEPQVALQHRSRSISLLIANRRFPCKQQFLAGPDGRADDGDGGDTTSKRIDSVGATGFEPATVRPPAERIHASMCLGASVVSYVSRAVDGLDR